jgi:hypothetical membrane protein
MTGRRIAGVAGIAACAVFWLAMLALGALRPSYSHSTNAISELGAIGTPHAPLWNIFGFIIPGVLLAISGKAIVDSISAQQTRAGRIARWLLPVFGLTVAGQGLIPAVMLDGVLIETSWYTRGHLIMSLISTVAWLGALLLLIIPMKRSSDWRGWHFLNMAAVLLLFVVAFMLGGRLPAGFVQRLVDAVVFAWFLAFSVRLILLEGRRGPAGAIVRATEN